MFTAPPSWPFLKVLALSSVLQPSPSLSPPPACLHLNENKGILKSFFKSHLTMDLSQDTIWYILILYYRKTMDSLYSERVLSEWELKEADINLWIIVMFYLLFWVLFWWHPITAEDQLVRKSFNANYINPSTYWMAWSWVHFQQGTFWTVCLKYSCLHYTSLWQKFMKVSLTSSAFVLQCW